jgi:hypothetical protein
MLLPSPWNSGTMFIAVVTYGASGGRVFGLSESV